MSPNICIYLSENQNDLFKKLNNCFGDILYNCKWTRTSTWTRTSSRYYYYYYHYYYLYYYYYYYYYYYKYHDTNITVLQNRVVDASLLEKFTTIGEGDSFARKLLVVVVVVDTVDSEDDSLHRGLRRSQSRAVVFQV